jgi:phenylacetate-CoA ligase
VTSAEADDSRYRAQIGYLFARSEFYRDKLRTAGFADARAVGGLDAIGQLPFTEKDELRRTVTDAAPSGAPLAAPIGGVVRG